MLVDVCETLKNTRLDNGYPQFQPSHLEITTIDVDNSVGNVIPEQASAHINVRFNPNYSGETLKLHLEELITKSTNAFPGKCQLAWHLGGEAFLTENNLLKTITKNAVERVTGIEPLFSTDGGTSDGRFMKELCPVVEFGLLSNQAHKIDEHVPVSDIRALTNVYSEILSLYCDRVQMH